VAAALDKYTLIVTEKPDAANRIAVALDNAGKPRRASEKGVPYYVAERDRSLVVVPALGHLYTVTSAEKKRGTFPVFNLKWATKHEVERKTSRIKVWLQAISNLAKNADSFIDACDYDLEGSIIGYCILKYACQGKEGEAQRMKYSTLTKEELEKAYEEPLPHLDFALIEAGLTRHEVDWLYGINLSRALTAAAKNASGKYTMLSTGRVQGPTLKFLAARERSIQRFTPTPYWTIKAKIRIDDKIYEAEHQKGAIQSRPEAESIVQYCKVKKAKILRIDKSRFLQAPPTPFDLGSLQSEAYSLFGYTPMRTSSIAQRLYLDALISYPRTSSQKLPPTIGYERILRSLANMREYTNRAGELLAKSHLKPAEGKRFDPAHPAIYPTGKLPPNGLPSTERNIWTLIVHRFLAVFADAAVRQSVEATVEVGGENFELRGRETLEEGWLWFYGAYARLKDDVLPAMIEGQEVTVQKVVLEDKFTQPPARFNPRTVLRKMEAGDIGTKATRAGTLQTLYDRNYISGEKAICVTDLGFAVTDVLRKFCPSVVSVEFTRKLEEEMDAVQQGKATKEQILQEAVENLKEVTASLKANERAVGAQLSHAVQQASLAERTVGTCPTCKTGKLVIIHSKKTGKRFVGCTNYFNGTCKTAYPLPQKGTVKATGKTCSTCNTPTMLVWFRIKRPLTICLNNNCPLSKKPTPPSRIKTTKPHHSTSEELDGGYGGDV
jgi:DNA topoisomerase I